MQKKALISVFDKEGISDFAKKLHSLDYTIYSSGGTLKHLQQLNIGKSVEELTHFPEILRGRVKTLHPNIHGGILADRSHESDLNDLKTHHIEPFDIVAVNLYPFTEKQKTIKNDEEMVEWIDVGGPTMLRAAAKNFKHVFSVCDPQDYDNVLEHLDKSSTESLYFRKYLAGKVFSLLSNYDNAIANYLQEKEEVKSFHFTKNSALRSGENPHQKGELLCSNNANGVWNNWEVLQGKELSFNNIRDADVTWKIACEFGNEENVCVATKHSTPCGAALGESNLDAFNKVLSCDNQSIFGGVVAFNQAIDTEEAHQLISLFLEVIIAPKFSEDALKILSKKKNLRLIQFKTRPQENEVFVQVDGGILLQDRNTGIFDKMEVVTKTQPLSTDIEQGVFGLKIIKYTRSNAILTVDNFMTTGIDGGQVNRYFASENCLKRAEGKNRILVSDGFFPFDDGAKLAHKNGVKVIFQPGGSKNDQMVIDYCDANNICMVFTRMRHFSH